MMYTCCMTKDYLKSRKPDERNHGLKTSVIYVKDSMYYKCLKLIIFGTVKGLIVSFVFRDHLQVLISDISTNNKILFTKYYCIAKLY